MNDIAPKGRRHNWPRKNDGIRVYRERCGAYVLVFPEQVQRSNGHLDAVGNVHGGDHPSLASTSVSREWFLNAGVKRVQWSEIPEDWQRALSRWFDGKPEGIRGFWAIGNQPKPEPKP